MPVHRSPHRLFYTLTCAVLRLFLLCFHKFRMRGRERIGVPRRVIVVANHCSNLDPMVMGVSFPWTLRYLAKTELFRAPIFGFLIRNLGAIAVERDDSQRAGAVLKLLLDLLEEGQSVLLFPEGHRSRDGHLQPLEGGFALLALKMGVPVIPALISGTFDALPPGGNWRWKPVSVTYGAPVHPSDIPADLSDKARRRAFVEKVEGALRALEAEGAPNT